MHGGFVVAASVGNVLSWRITEQDAVRDPLTRLPNRLYLIDALDHHHLAQGRHRHLALLVLDLDNFRDANDAFGHHIGDALLCTIGHRLRAQIAPGDLLVHMGGDEFAVLLTDVDNPGEATATAHRLVDLFNEPIDVDGVDVACAASLGLAFGGPAISGAVDLLRNADLAMYRAKREGGAQVALYDQTMYEDAVRRAELEPELRLALAREEFVVHYQPIWALPGERLQSTEALVRWQHPTRGLLGPIEFIPAAEQTGLIVGLGAWILRTACEQTAQWHARNPGPSPLSVAVNLSPRQLADRALVSTVAGALRDSGLPPSSLCLEITESSVIKDFDATLVILHALRELGVSLALDDFGTGYSSLSYLRQLPVSTVKIDRSFVKDLDSSSSSVHIVRAVIDLAHGLGMTVTAEGAQTRAQVDTLAGLGSDRVQGYFLGRPMPAAGMGDVLLSQTTHAHPTDAQPADGRQAPAQAGSRPRALPRPRDAADPRRVVRPAGAVRKGGPAAG